MRLLVLGGSLGAQALNERIAPALASLPAAQRPLVRHQGGRTVELAEAAYAKAGVEADVQAFIGDMPEAYGWADLVVCRAGAMTVAELAAAGCAAPAHAGPRAGPAGAGRATAVGDQAERAGHRAASARAAPAAGACCWCGCDNGPRGGGRAPRGGCARWRFAG